MVESMNNKRIISFPHMGNYYIVIKQMLQNTLNCEIMTPPPITKRTIDIGAKYSPDFVCVPFKYNLGNYIEALEKGANFLVQAGGGCRFGYYAEIQEQILRDLGYDFEFFNILDTGNVNPRRYYKEFKKVNPKLDFRTFFKAFRVLYNQVIIMDKIEDYIRQNIGFEVNKGSFEKLEKLFYKELSNVNTAKEVKNIGSNFEQKFRDIPINKKETCLKVGIVGELYMLMEPFSNYFIEKELGKRGIAVKRHITVSYLLFSKEHSNKKQIIKSAYPYLKYELGADGTDSISRSNEFAQNGYDGIIHIKPFGCTPEVNAMSILQKLGNDKNIPILYFSFDAQTSETGVNTRLEAFYDMLLMRKESNII